MIRFISFLTSLVLTMSILAGCGAGDVHFEKESTEEQETIEVTNALADEKVLPYGLSDVTLNYLSSLDKTVDLYFLMELGELRGEKELEDLVNLLDSYASFEQINFKDLSPDENPEIINLLDPDGTYDLSSGDVILRCDNSIMCVKASKFYSYITDDNGIIKEQLFHGENLITGAIKAVAENIIPVIYFTTGHGEKEIETDYTQFSKNLINANYIPMSLDLSAEASVPENAAAVIIAAPQSDISEDERAKLENYMDKGGNLSLLMSPNGSNTEYENISEIMMQYGLAMNYDTVSETNSANHILGDNSTILANVTDMSSVSDEIGDLTSMLHETESSPCYMPASRSVYCIQANNASDIIACPLIETYETAVSEPFGGYSDYNDKLSGILCLAALSQDKSRNNSKVVFMGNAEFINDEHVMEGYTMIPVMLYLSTVSWMRSSELDMGIAPKTIN